MDSKLKAANELVEKIVSLIPNVSVAKVELGDTDHPADIYIEGHNGALGCLYSAWLPLMAIRSLVNWCSPDVAEMTDYPEMAMEGDWSGVRDTDKDKLFAIYERYVLPLL